MRNPIRNPISSPHTFGAEESYGIPLSYRLPKSGEVTVRIYRQGFFPNQLQIIRVLSFPIKPPGFNTIYWDGRNDLRERVPPGIYAFSVQVGNTIAPLQRIKVVTTPIPPPFAPPAGYTPVVSVDIPHKAPAATLKQMAPPPPPEPALTPCFIPGYTPNLTPSDVPAPIPATPTDTRRRKPDYETIVQPIEQMRRREAERQAAIDEANKPKFPPWAWAVVAFFGMMLFTKE